MRRLHSRAERGFGVVEALAAAAILVAVTFGIVKVFSSSGKQIMKAEVASGFDGLNNAALNNLREAISNIGANQDQGMCRVIATDMKSGGVGYIKAHLPSANTTMFDSDIAARFTSNHWRVASCPSASGSYKKCYEPTEQNPAINRNLLARKPIVAVEITPIALRKADGSGTSSKLVPVALKNGSSVEINARDLAFLVSSEVTYIPDMEGVNKADTALKTAATTKKALTHSMVWAGEFSCKKTVSDELGTRQLLVNASGIGSGSDPFTLFSSQKEAGDDLMNIIFSTVSYTEAVVNNQQRAETLVDPEHTFTSACIERSYRCPDSNADRIWAPEIRVEGSAQYNRNNEFVQTNSLVARMKIQFAEANGTGVIETNSTISGFSATGTGTNIFNFPTSRVSFAALVNNADSGVCPRLCSSGNNYNHSSLTDSLHRVRVNLELIQKGNKDVYVYDNRPTGCVCCYGKQCQAIGTKNGSNCYRQPPEPLDSRVPECAASNNSNISEFRTHTALTPTDQGCVAAEMKDGKLKLSVEPCSQSLPYVCFSQGSYKVAYRPTSTSQATGPFAGGRRACYEMGYIEVDASETRDRLNTQGNLDPARLPPESNGSFRYMDSAFAGIFVAPSTNGEIARISGVLDTEPKGKYWLALRTNADLVYAEPPLIDYPTAQNVSFFDNAARLQFDTDPSHGFSTAGANAAMLVHGRRFYGVLHVSDQQDSSHSVLCYRDGEYFLSSERVSRHSEGVRVCREADAHFLPPLTPLQWISAMKRVNQIDQRLPWPSGGNSTGSKPNAAWVGMTSPGSDGVWGAPALGITHKQIRASFVDATSSNVRHSVCRKSGGGLEITEDSCSDYFSPENMTPFQRVALVRKIASENLTNKKFKISSGTAPPTEDDAPPSTSTSTSTSTDTSTSTSTGTGTSP
jgi:hypothetical protein